MDQTNNQTGDIRLSNESVRLSEINEIANGQTYNENSLSLNHVILKTLNEFHKRFTVFCFPKSMNDYNKFIHDNNDNYIVNDEEVNTNERNELVISVLLTRRYLLNGSDKYVPLKSLELVELVECRND
jgi:hypothetical protein